MRVCSPTQACSWQAPAMFGLDPERPFVMRLQLKLQPLDQPTAKAELNDY